MNRVASMSSSRTWSFPKGMIADLAAFTALIWLGFVIVVSIASLGIDRWGTLDESVWEMARQIAQWFFLFLGVFLGTDLLPRYVTHGKTRRDFYIEANIFIAAISAFGALLLTLGWIIERALFGALGVQQQITQTGMFDSPRDYGLIFLEALIILTIWTLAGFFISVVWYRDANLMLFAIVAAIIVAAIVEMGVGTDLGPISGVTRRFLDPDQPPLFATFGIALTGFGVMAWLAWIGIKDIAIRNVAA